MAAKKHNARPVRTAGAASASKAQRAADSAREASPRRRDSPPFHDMIAEAAYYKAASRGFLPGLELDDWLEAEQELRRSGMHGG